MNWVKTRLSRVGASGLVAIALGAGSSLPALAANTASPASASASVQVAQATGDVNVFERPSYVNTCRSSGASALTVYADTARTQAVGTVPPYTRITLTGVLGSGIAQIKTPFVGWVPTATLLTNCDARPPVNNQVCYQVTADGLAVRSVPYGSVVSSVVRGDRVFASNPPQRQTTSDGRIWIRVTIRGVTGWVAESGPGGDGRNLIPCP